MLLNSIAPCKHCMSMHPIYAPTRVKIPTNNQEKISLARQKPNNKTNKAMFYMTFLSRGTPLALYTSTHEKSANNFR